MKICLFRNRTMVLFCVRRRTGEAGSVTGSRGTETTPATTQHKRHDSIRQVSKYKHVCINMQQVLGQLIPLFWISIRDFPIFYLSNLTNKILKNISKI